MRYFLLIIMWVMFIKPVYATAWGTDCSYTTKTVNIQIPSGKKITIDPNAPVGTVFFEHYVPDVTGQDFKCQTATNYSRQHGYVYGAGGQTVTISGGGLTGAFDSTYSVYKTDVQGIGLVVRFSSYAFPILWSGQSYSNTVLDYTNSSTMVFDIDVVKYGDIPPGARTVHIDSTVITSIDWIVRIFSSGNNSRLPLGSVPTVRFVLSPATFDIVTGTCDTPDFTVDLGKRRKGDTSNREGGKFATPWTDASIRLTNCPVFYGTGQLDLKETTRDNVMTVTLTPGNATTSNQGIMPVDNVSQAATGVGIQLAYGTAASPQPVNFSAGKAEQKFTMSSSQGQNYTIPLVARYIQTAGSVNDIMPGKANGKITYLINYY